MHPVEGSGNGVTFFVHHAQPKAIRGHVGKHLKDTPPTSSEEKHLAETARNIELVSEQFRFPPVKPQNNRPARKRSRIQFGVVLSAHREVFPIPSILGQRTKLGRNSLHFREDVLKVANLLSVVFRQTNIPNGVMAEMEDHGIRTCANDHAQRPVAEQRSLKKTGGRSRGDDRMSCCLLGRMKSG